jgi:hypothetical protein
MFVLSQLQNSWTPFDAAQGLPVFLQKLGYPGGHTSRTTRLPSGVGPAAARLERAARTVMSGRVGAKNFMLTIEAGFG